MKKVLVVDDSALMVSVIGNFIKKSGKELEIISAKDGQEAIDKYDAQKPDLVFMDIKMPVIDGITALERIRAKDARAKIVMCTSIKEEEQERRAKAAGAVGYIMKPFSSQDILDALNKNL